ncbi:MAG TPA: MarR family transcriptional regulator [Nakamurella sp.]
MIDQPDDDTARTAAVARELRVLLGALRRRLRAVGHVSDFTPSQLAVLSRLERDGPATVTALAQAEGVRPQSMGATVATLESAGYISGAPHPTDGRQTLMSITDAARKEFGAGRAAREDWLFHALQSNLTRAERQQLAESIQLLGRVIEP